MRLADANRFWLKVDKSDGCWTWNGQTRLGYGRFTIWLDGKQHWHSAHRVAWTLANGPVPRGLELHHRCENKACVRPEHLELVTRLENVRRSVPASSRKTHCPKGHPYDDENTGHWRGKRYCKTCNRNHSLAYYYRTKGKRCRTA